MTPKFIDKLNNWSVQFKQKLWTQSNDKLNQVTNPRLKNFILASLTIAILIILLFLVLVTIEYVHGDHPIFSSARDGAICRDGWVSSSTGSGTCSHHGGVDHWTHPQIGFHYCNPQPYWLTITSSFIFMVSFSAFSVPFRQKFIACSAEGIYIIGVFVYVVLFISAVPFYLIYLGLKRLDKKT